MRYQNPIVPGFNPDPSICRVGEDYYLVTSTFEYFPGVPIYHSRDLKNWEHIGHCLTRDSQVPLEKCRCSGGIYAPVIRYHDGVFYMVTTNVTGGGNFFVTATDPRGPWSEPVWVKHRGIDPSLFFDQDGKVYFTGTGTASDGQSGVCQAEIDIKTGELLTPVRCVWKGTGGRYPEAPHLYKFHGMYYMMIAEGGTEYGHYEVIARSDSPWGPFVSCPRNPILSHRDEGQSPIQGVGHADIVQAQDGSWYMVFLAFRLSVPMFHHLGRETFLAPMVWDEDGWPVVGDHGTVQLDMDGITLPECPLPQVPLRDDFDSPVLDVKWSYLRNPRRAVYSLTARPGALTLTGADVSLMDVDSPSFVCVRQRHMDCRFAAALDFAPQRDEEAGLTVFYNNLHHYDVAVVAGEEGRQIILRKSIGDLSVVVAREDIPDGTVILEGIADAKTYRLGYRTLNAPRRELGTALTQFVSTEATPLSFTGVMLGLYATGNGRTAENSAYFDWFEYEG